MPEKTYILTENVRQAIAAYLAKRPWEEVAQLMSALGSLPAVTPTRPKKSAG
jgi:hypothetical protein